MIARQNVSIKRVLFLLVLILLVIGLFFVFGSHIGFPRTWAIDCGCFGIKNYFEDINGINRCSCYGISTWVWLE
jgi:hypothetical protein